MYGLGERDLNDVVVEAAIEAVEAVNPEVTFTASSNEAIGRASMLIDWGPCSVESNELKSTLGQSLSPSVTGNTTNSYVVILSFNCLIYLKKTLVLACTHGSNDLQYWIRGYARSESIYYDELWADVKLAHGNVQPMVIENFYNIITVEVKSATSGLASSYVLDHCGGP